MKHQPASAPARQGGFTFIEIMVAVTIFTIVIAAIYQLLALGRSNRFTVDQNVESIQNVRNAMNLMSRECLNAGVDYFPVGAQLPDDSLQNILGTAADADSTADFLSPVIAGNDKNANSLSGAMTDQVTFVYGDDTFTFASNGPDGIAGNADDVNGTQLLLDKNTNGEEFQVASGYDITPCRTGDIYLIATSGTSPQQALGMCTGTATKAIKFATTDTLGINKSGGASVLKPLAVSAAVKARLTRVVWITFYVSADGTLYRRLYGDYSASGDATSGSGLTVASTKWFDEPLAFGVENMQLEYLMKDGTVLQSPTSAVSRNVRQIAATITARGTADGSKAGGAVSRTVVTTTFNARNLAYANK